MRPPSGPLRRKMYEMAGKPPPAMPRMTIRRRNKVRSLAAIHPPRVIGVRFGVDPPPSDPCPDETLVSLVEAYDISLEDSDLTALAAYVDPKIPPPGLRARIANAIATSEESGDAQRVVVPVSDCLIEFDISHVYDPGSYTCPTEYSWGGLNGTVVNITSSPPESDEALFDDIDPYRTWHSGYKEFISIPVPTQYSGRYTPISYPEVNVHIGTPHLEPVPPGDPIHDLPEAEAREWTPPAQNPMVQIPIWIEYASPMTIMYENYAQPSGGAIPPFYVAALPHPSFQIGLSPKIRSADEVDNPVFIGSHTPESGYYFLDGELTARLGDIYTSAHYNASALGPYGDATLVKPTDTKAQAQTYSETYGGIVGVGDTEAEALDALKDNIAAYNSSKDSLAPSANFNTTTGRFEVHYDTHETALYLNWNLCYNPGEYLGIVWQAQDWLSGAPGYDWTDSNGIPRWGGFYYLERAYTSPLGSHQIGGWTVDDSSTGDQGGTIFALWEGRGYAQAGSSDWQEKTAIVVDPHFYGQVSSATTGSDEPLPDPLPDLLPDPEFPTPDPGDPTPVPCPGRVSVQYDPDAGPQVDVEWNCGDPPNPGDIVDVDLPDPGDPDFDFPDLNFPVKRFRWPTPELDPCNFQMPGLNGSPCGPPETGGGDWPGGGGGGGRGGSRGGGHAGGNGGAGGGTGGSKYLDKKKCFDNKLATEIIILYATQLGVDPDKIIIDPDGTPCTQRYTGCFAKGTNKFDIIKKMANLCGYGVVDPGGGIIVVPPEPTNVHHYFNEYDNIFTLERLYSDADLCHHVEVFRPEGIVGGRRYPAVSKVALVWTPFVADPTSIKYIRETDYNLTDAQLQNIANVEAKKISGMGARVQVTTLWDIGWRFGMYDQIHTWRYSLGWYPRWMIRSIQHTFDENGHLSLAQASFLGYDPTPEVVPPAATDSSLRNQLTSYANLELQPV